MTQYYVGIDLHKTVAQVCVTTADGEVAAEQRIRLDGDGADQLLSFLADWREQRWRSADSPRA